MALVRMTSPHAKGNNHTQTIMLWVLGATLPGILVLTWFYGFGTLINILYASAVALLVEALVLAIRKRPIGFYLRDGSALVTAWLLALALPPYAPWWLTLIAVSFAIVFGKQLYGGLGQNPFNPAMLGYVVVLISFPVEMTSWPAWRGIEAVVPDVHATLGLLDGLSRIFLPVSFYVLLMGLGYYGYTYWSSHRFTNMSMLLFTTSVQIFMMGLIAEQVAQMRFERSDES